MFSSSNFFKGLDCPFYEKGPGCCKRPYCHFRHVRKELPETSNGTEIPSQSNAVSKEPVQVSYRALPSVQKSSSRHTSKHHQHHRDKKGRVHARPKSKPPSQFSYIPTPLAQLTKLNQQKDALGEVSEELPMSTNLDTKSWTLSESSVTSGEIIGKTDSLLLEEDKLKVSDAETGSITKSDAVGMEEKSCVDEGKVPSPKVPLQLTAEGNMGQYSNNESTAINKEWESSEIGFSTSSGEISSTSKDSRMVSNSVTSSGCYEEFVALQKQEINRIEAQLAELAKQKKLVEQSLETATVGKARTGPPADVDPLAFSASPPSGASQEVSMRKNELDKGYGQHGSSGPKTSDSDTGNKYIAQQHKISEEYDPLSNYTAAASNQEEIAAFLKDARRKSNEKKESSMSLTYVPTAISVSPTNEQADSEPEGAFSSSDEEDQPDQVSDADDREQSEGHIKNVDSGFSESFKDASGIFEEVDKPEVVLETPSKAKEDNKKCDSLEKVEKMKNNVVKTQSPASKDVSDKKKIMSKSSSEKKEKSLQHKKDSKGHSIGVEKKKLSSSDLTLFFEKRNTLSSIKTAKNDKSPTDRILSSKTTVSSQKKQRKEVTGTSNVIGNNKQSENKKKLVHKSNEHRESHLQSNKMEQKKKITRKVSLKQTGDTLVPKSMESQGKDGNFKKKIKALAQKEANAKRKLSQLFGDDSSNESDDSGPEVKSKLDPFAISSDSDGRILPQNKERSKVQRSQHAQNAPGLKRGSKEDTRKDVFCISSDSESGTQISKKSSSVKVMQKNHLPRQRIMKHAKVVSNKSDEKVKNFSQIKGGPSTTSKPYHKDVRKSSAHLPRHVTSNRDIDSDNSDWEEFDPVDDEIDFIAEEDDYAKRSKDDTPFTGCQKLNDGKKRPSEGKSLLPKKKIKLEEKVREEKGSSKQDRNSSDLSDDDDFESVEDFDMESFQYDSDDVKDSDPYEECLKIFNENWNVIPPDEQKKKVMEIQTEMKSRDEELENQSSKRHAHTPKFDTRKVRKITKRTKALPTPSQICHQRFMEAQKKALENASKKKDSEADNFVRKSSQKRISHFDIHRQQNGEGSRISHSSKALNLKQKTLAMTATKDSKRVAHVPAKVSKRPVLPTEYGSKVSSNIRQRYLNLFIDELLKTCKTEKAAFQKALAEEKEVYDRASSRSIYLNLSVNTLKRLRRDNTASQPAASSSNNRFAVSHQAVLGGKAATLTTYTLHKNYPQKDQKLEGLVLYEKLKQYIATEEQLVENGYPRPSEESGKAVIQAVEKTKSSDPNQQVCCRCGKTFLRRPNGKYITKETCVHHWGKLWTKRVAGALESRYSCCSGDVQASGCSIAKYHVTDDKFINSTGFMTTMAKSPPPDGNPGVFALDCEMCYTTMGVELTRVTVVSDKMERVYDSLVKPSNEVVDYNTKFSGITEEDLEYVKTTLQNVQAVLLSMFSSETILIGHSLESDLLALKLIHSTVIDTALVFPHRRGPPYKRALRTLTAEYLQKLIQDDESGHDSMEDARSCMELMVYKVKQDAKLRSQRR